MKKENQEASDRISIGTIRKKKSELEGTIQDALLKFVVETNGVLPGEISIDYREGIRPAQKLPVPRVSVTIKSIG